MKKLGALFIVLVLVLTVSTTAFAAYTPGTYSATAPGFGGDVTVTVTVDESQITDVQIVGDKETVGIGGTAVQELPAVIMDAQGTDYDGWTGASFTSAAVKAALTEALAQANPALGYGRLTMRALLALRATSPENKFRGPCYLIFFFYVHIAAVYADFRYLRIRFLARCVAKTRFIKIQNHISVFK